jgi:hypothetical protein
MKKIVITLVMITLAGMALFAEGSQEETTWEPGSGYMGRGYTNTDQANWGRGQMPMDRGYAYLNQDFRGWGSMPMRGGNTYADQKNTGPAGMSYTNPEFDIESLTLTGIIDLSDVNVPKLTVGENTYELMVPYRLDYDIDINDGDEITINGFEVPAYRRAADSELTNLMVTGATFNGTEYDLNMINDGPMGYGRGPGMMNNYGPAYGRKGRSGRFNNGGFQNNSMGWGSQPNGMMNTPYNRPFRR